MFFFLNSFVYHLSLWTPRRLKLSVVPSTSRFCCSLPKAWVLLHWLEKLSRSLRKLEKQFLNFLGVFKNVLKRKVSRVADSKYLNLSFLFYKRIFKSTCFTGGKYWPKLQRNLSGNLKFGLSRVNHLYRTKAFKIYPRKSPPLISSIQ